MPAHTSTVSQGWGATHTCAYCHGFGSIPPLIRGSDGRMHINPDYEMVKRFHLAAEPFGETLGPGESRTFTFTVPAEEEGLGDLLVNEFFALYEPEGIRNVFVDFLNLQTDRLFQNAPVPTTLIMGNAHLNTCLPCCFLIQATNSLQVRVRNDEATDIQVRLVARGKRFLTRDYDLRARMLQYWNMLPSYSYFLTLDDEEVLVPAGETVSATMKVPGHGDFEVKWPRCEVLNAATGAQENANDILVTVAEGIGRQWQSDPLPLGAFVATPTLDVAGFPGGIYRAASAGHCPSYTQLFKRNTFVRHTFENTSGTDVIVRLTYAGCFHQVDECPPGRSIDRIRSLEPTIGPMLIPQGDYCAPQQQYYPEEPFYNEEPIYQSPQASSGMQPPAQRPGGSAIFTTVPGGAGSVQAGGPSSYVPKYYEAGGGGMAVPTAEAAKAHGLTPGQVYAPGFRGMQGMGAGPVIRRGPFVWDPISRAWKRG